MSIRVEELGADALGRIVEIDRSEHARHLYTYDAGELRRSDVSIAIPTWTEEMLEKERTRLARKLAAGGALFAVLDGERLVGMAVLGGERLGKRAQQLELAFLYVSNGYRRRGIARALMDESVRRARERCAEQLYISASETDSAIGFYLVYGCRLADRVDPELYAAEPADIHLVLDL